MLILFISVVVAVNGVEPLLHLLDVYNTIYNGKESKFMVRGKMVPGKNGRQKSGPRKNFLQKLFSVKRMLGNLNNFFVFIN